jgi:hypothetical protein
VPLVNRDLRARLLRRSSSSFAGCGNCEYYLANLRVAPEPPIRATRSSPSEFKIDAARPDMDGKGDTQPIHRNGYGGWQGERPPRLVRHTVA